MPMPSRDRALLNLAELIAEYYLKGYEDGKRAKRDDKLKEHKRT